MLAWVVINQGTLVESGWDSRLGMVNTRDCRRTGIDMVLRMGEVLYVGGREGRTKELPSRRKGTIRSGDLLLGKKDH